ncbi:MAG: hypothetical protein CMJ46_08190 [Planctomyces sp.]|nr:hypothetical protein [Planctomyces sp.]
MKRYYPRIALGVLALLLFCFGFTLIRHRDRSGAREASIQSIERIGGEVQLVGPINGRWYHSVLPATYLQSPDFAVVLNSMELSKNDAERLGFHLRELDHISALFLLGLPVDDEFIDSMGELHNVSILNLGATSVSPEKVREIFKWDGLESINFEQNEKFSEDIASNLQQQFAALKLER